MKLRSPKPCIGGRAPIADKIMFHNYNYLYTGLGDRVQQTVNGVTMTYVLDLNTGLTQVLSDETDTYLYGLSRIGEEDTAWDYYLGDALGSVRHLTDGSGVVSLTQSYQPFGETLNLSGTHESNWGFTGEWEDISGFLYLRARYYNQKTGTFINIDPVNGYIQYPQSLNGFSYAYGNPVNLTDPGGNDPTLWACLAVIADGPLPVGDLVCAAVLAKYGIPFILSVAAYYSALEATPEIIDLLICLPVVTDTQQETTWTWEQLLNLPSQDPDPDPETKPIEFPPIINIDTETENDDFRGILYHYTDFQGYIGIISSGSINPSLADDNSAAFGKGVYFTDITPLETIGTTDYQLSRAIQRSPWHNMRVRYYFGVDVSGLVIRRVSDIFSKTYGFKGIYLYDTLLPLPISDRLIEYGETPVIINE